MHGEAARHADHLARDEARIVAGEKCDDAGNVLGLAQAAEGNGALQRLVNLLPGWAFLHEGLQKRRLGWPGADDVDGDALLGQLTRERLRKGDDPALAGRIDALARRADAARIRGDIDDAP